MKPKNPNKWNKEEQRELGGEDFGRHKTAKQRKRARNRMRAAAKSGTHDYWPLSTIQRLHFMCAHSSGAIPFAPHHCVYGDVRVEQGVLFYKMDKKEHYEAMRGVVIVYE